MAKSTFIDIGRKPGSMLDIPSKASKPYYPSITVSEAEGFDPEVGDDVVLQGRVTRCVDDENGGESYTVEVTGVQCDCEGDLASAMNKIAKKKAQDAESE